MSARRFHTLVRLRGLIDHPSIFTILHLRLFAAAVVLIESLGERIVDANYQGRTMFLRLMHSSYVVTLSRDSGGNSVRIT